MKIFLGKFSIALVLFIYALIFVFIGLLIGVVYYEDEAAEKELSFDNFSRYISSYDVSDENLTTNNLLDKDSGFHFGGEINKVKEGFLEEDPNRKIVKFENDLTQEQMENLENEYAFSFTDDLPKNGVYVIDSNEFSRVASLEASELVSSMEIDKPVQLLSQQVDWGVERIGAKKIWGETEGRGVLVAVIDTGVQTDHEDLIGNISEGFDFVNNNEFAYDDNGHGTHVAGIIAAHNNTVGVVGGAYSAQIMPVKVLNAQGYGYLSDVVKGIYYAVDNDARVVNLSLGTSYDSSVLRDAISYAGSNGVLVVAAAGNNSEDTCLYPANYVEAICVVATDQDNKLARFSNRGGELSAPGVSNYSTYIGNRYAYLSGTSMATPHVSASAALVFSFCTDCTANETREILRETSVDLGEVGEDSIFGYGLVDVFAAISSFEEEEEEQEEEEAPEDSEDVDVPERRPTNVRPESPPTQRPAPVLQRLSILEPELNGNRRITLSDKEDINISFQLEPKVEDSVIDRIVVLIDNEEVFSTNEQSGEYTFEKDDLTNSQYFIRVIAYFEDKRVDHQSFIIDLTRTKPIERNNRANPNIPSNRRVLGVSTGFRY